MNVLLVKPYNESDHIQPSLGLGYLAQAIRSRHAVQILDCIKERVWHERLIAHVERVKPDVVGFQMYTYDLGRVRQELAAVKQHNPKIVTVAGGPHPSALPQQTFEHIGDVLDFVFVGESETSFPVFLDLLAAANCAKERIPLEQLATVPGLAWMASDGFHSNQACVLQDLDSLGFPAWDLIQPQTYPPAQHGAFFRNSPIAPVMTGRGCPFNCTFCAGHIITGKRVRKRSVERVIEEITLLTTQYGIKEIHIVDDNFTIYKDYVLEFCRRLAEEKIHISWATPNGVRLDRLDEEMLLAMKACGYYLASVGIEFGSDRMLEAAQKGITCREIAERVQTIHKVGLDVAGFFIMGYPGETREEVMQTIRFACELPLIRANFFTFLPLPGTEAYRLLEQELQLDKVDWEHFGFTHALYAAAGMSEKELKNLQRLAFMRFYLRPAIFWRNVRDIKSVRQFGFLLKRAYRWVIAP